jgi:hypothetical protein
LPFFTRSLGPEEVINGITLGLGVCRLCRHIYCYPQTLVLSCPVLPVLPFPPLLLHKVFIAPSLDSGTKLKSRVPFPSAHLRHIPAILTLPWGAPPRSSKSTKYCQSLPPSSSLQTLPYPLLFLPYLT